MPSLCTPCDRSFSSDEALQQHLQTSRVHALFDCNTCHRKFKTKDALEQHLKTSPIHLPSVNCEACGRSFKSDEALQQHLQSPAHAPSFDCESCDRSFKSDEALKQHMKSPVHDPLFPCKNCDRSFKSAEALKQHMKSPAHDSTLNCQTCNRRFQSKGALEDHLRNSPVHGQKSKTPLDTFFGSFRRFKYDPSLPPATSFGKLRDQKGWERGDPEGEEAWERYQAALAAELETWFGAEDDLTAWHSLCRAIGIEPPPQTCALCQKAARNTHVNIVDLIHWRRNESQKKVQIFRDVAELRAYTRGTGKIFHSHHGRDEHGGNMVLRHLLRRIFR
ncbi:unnamed protein product [Clonostachys rosea]|uniref:C2H2-type domain-containing protein n=1 Tax=Bionectria ochroleuca TaxID=29856 RepID=A0ABY6TUX3_BIOOC|nr:unnamed protein product [Clonostachys rosea]